MQRKAKLQVNYETPDWVCQEEEDLARELEERFHGRFTVLLRSAPKAFSVLAFVGCNPEILAETGCAFERRVFAFCFARCPDLVIEALQFVRKGHARFLQNSQSQTGIVHEFLLHKPELLKKNGKFMLRECLRDEDYKPGTFEPSKRIKVIPVQQLTDGEIAEFLSLRGVLNPLGIKITKDIVKKARQALPAKGKR
jgi:hypothetical protein